MTTNSDDAAAGPETRPKREIETLLAVMAALRTPETGCPWDLEQTFKTIAPYTIEEAYEVMDAIDNGTKPELCDELGDLLLQVVYHAQMAAEDGDFDFHDVVESINTKMIRRHPHVFGDAAARAAGVKPGFWENIKAQERKSGSDTAQSHLDGVPLALPALTRAQKLQKRAAKVGFDWPEIAQVLAKVVEEAQELADAGRQDSTAAQEEEFGDLLFAAVNLGRHLGLDAETALRKANQKFIRRFNYIESELKASDSSLDAATLDEMDAIWNQVRTREKTGKP